MDLPTPSQDEPTVLLPAVIPASSRATSTDARIAMLGAHHRLDLGPVPSEPLPCVSTPLSTPEVLYLNPIPLPQPHPTQVSVIPTPYLETSPDLRSLTTSGIEGIPRFSPRTTHPIAKPSVRDLRLPSFRELGIAAPHSERPRAYFEPFPQLDTSLSSWPPDSTQSAERKVLTGFFGDPSPSLSLDERAALSSQSSLQHFILTTTPPADSDPTRMSTMSGTHGISEGFGEMSLNSPTQELALGAANPVAGGTEQTSPTDSSWSPDILPEILSLISTSIGQISHRPQLTILTHALPLPLESGYCYPMIIAHIHSELAPKNIISLSHCYAVSGSIEVSSLVTPPAITPTTVSQGVDYFTAKVYDSAVSIPDYQRYSPVPLPQIQTASRSVFPASTTPRPAVPPGSVQVSVTERYIPPTTSAEFADLFTPTSGRSLISDRLVELSDDSGIFVFIYLTRNGAETFKKEYLGTVLDPLLRSMMVRKEITHNVCESIGTMEAINDMLTFSELKARMKAYCTKASTRDGIPSSVSNTLVSYTLEHSSTTEVKLGASWGDSWVKQEKARVTEVFESYIRAFPHRARSTSSQANVPMESRERMRDENAAHGGGSMAYILEVLEGVKKGAFRNSGQQEHGVEVGVFVVKKERFEGQSQCSVD